MRFRTSIYADDAVIFVKPTTTDMANLKQLLTSFDEVTGLVSNLQKTSLTPINCRNIDLEEVLADFGATRTVFPIRYLGLPLSVGCLRKIDFQPIIDKAKAKLSTWNGRLLTQAGRLSITKSVLSSQPIYLLTVLKTYKEIL